MSINYKGFVYHNLCNLCIYTQVYLIQKKEWQGSRYLATMKQNR